MKKLLFLFICLSLLGVALSAQEISERKEVAVFNLSYTDWKIPTAALGMVDQQIQNVFVNIGRFDVLGMTLRLNAQDVGKFIDQIKDMKEERIEIPEEVRLGEQTFTEADFNKLVGSFIIVIPSVTYYNLELKDNGDYYAEIETAFNFVNVDEGRAFANFTVATSASADNANRAVRQAVDYIPNRLTYELRSVPEFMLRTGIVDVKGRNVLMEFGRNMGVHRGDEYVITAVRVLPSGHEITDETGLLVITDVEETISTAKVLYASPRPAIGDQLVELPRFGLDFKVYGHYMLGDEEKDALASAVAVGFQAVLTRGVFFVRPVIGAEIVFIEDAGTFYWNQYIGPELNWMFGRFQLNPMAAVGVTGAYDSDAPAGEEFDLSHFGFKAQLSGSYLLTRDIKLFAEAGYALWMGINTNNTYGGLLAGGGVTIKF